MRPSLSLYYPSYALRAIHPFFAEQRQLLNHIRFNGLWFHVHGKGMIVDDEYMILGSANINQRSMAGSRDTEIAMGAYQPHHTWGRKKGHPHGQIYGFRMSLWAEHLGILDIDDCFKEPKDLACIKSVNKIAEDNWRKYTAKDFTPLQGHLLKYPIQVDTNGEVGCLPEQGTFPDGTVAVLGSENLFPALITT
uniref:phospholipase D n=1 Tax=Fagus sylvatica TaxID=28930 RepID=A0A2N9G445_FAGSY